MFGIHDEMPNETSDARKGLMLLLLGFGIWLGGVGVLAEIRF